MKITPNTCVLIVEDHPHIRQALCDILESYGYRILSAGNGLEALEVLQSSRPDVIVCDIVMPGMDGYTFLQHTRANPEWRLLPFIFLTARGSNEDQRRAREIGTDDYLTKPVDSSDLVVAIENALHRGQLMQEEIKRSMDNLRTRMVGLLQHEFRTPLTFVLGYAELLASSDPSMIGDEELKMAASAILDGGHRLQHLIESFLLLAELQEHSLTPTELEKVPAPQLWRDALRDEAAGWKQAGMPVTLVEDDNTNLVTCNPRLLNIALGRLLDYVERNRRTLTNGVECSVTDRFPYIGLRVYSKDTVRPPELPSAHLGRSANVMESSAWDRAELDLALARHVTELHAGNLVVEEDQSGGTSFTVWLPAASGPEEPV
ncbi:MAG: hybrid sensor histidine kinase/response regulator [Caldilineaceae bacterium]|nr:hybrid sensor histidine kinase/response regulator [Caldilineaceae bacterium]